MVLSIGVYAQRKKKTPAVDTVTTVYKGVLPCADCSGIDTELKLIHERNAGMGTYILTETYMGHENMIFETKGEWTHHRGTPDDKNATVYDLYDSEKPDVSSRYYLRLKDGSIKMLDKELREIDSKFNYVLRRVTAP